MNIKEIDQLTRIALGCAKYSFSIGTAIFLAYCISRFEFLTFAGLFFIMVTVFVNALVLFLLFIFLLKYPKQYPVILQTSFILLLNVPVAIFYLWIFTQLPHTLN